MSIQYVVVSKIEAAHRLQAFREAVGMTQAQLAKASGILARSISYWEKGRGEPSLRAAVKLAHVLGCTAESLVHMAEVV